MRGFGNRHDVLAGLGRVGSSLLFTSGEALKGRSAAACWSLEEGAGDEDRVLVLLTAQGL